MNVEISILYIQTNIKYWYSDQLVSQGHTHTATQLVILPPPSHE